MELTVGAALAWIFSNYGGIRLGDSLYGMYKRDKYFKQLSETGVSLDSYAKWVAKHPDILKSTDFVKVLNAGWAQYVMKARDAFYRNEHEGGLMNSEHAEILLTMEHCGVRITLGLGGLERAFKNPTQNLDRIADILISSATKGFYNIARLDTVNPFDMDFEFKHYRQYDEVINKYEKVKAAGTLLGTMVVKDLVEDPPIIFTTIMLAANGLVELVKSAGEQANKVKILREMGQDAKKMGKCVADFISKTKNRAADRIELMLSYVNSVSFKRTSYGADWLGYASKKFVDDELVTNARFIRAACKSLQNISEDSNFTDGMRARAKMSLVVAIAEAERNKFYDGVKKDLEETLFIIERGKEQAKARNAYIELLKELQALQNTFEGVAGKVNGFITTLERILGDFLTKIKNKIKRFLFIKTDDMEKVANVLKEENYGQQLADVPKVMDDLVTQANATEDYIVKVQLLRRVLAEAPNITAIEKAVVEGVKVLQAQEVKLEVAVETAVKAEAVAEAREQELAIARAVKVPVSVATPIPIRAKVEIPRPWGITM